LAEPDGAGLPAAGDDGDGTATGPDFSAGRTAGSAAAGASAASGSLTDGSFHKAMVFSSNPGRERNGNVAQIGRLGNR
jgi:hypothetical protein